PCRTHYDEETCLYNGGVLSTRTTERPARDGKFMPRGWKPNEGSTTVSRSENNSEHSNKFPKLLEHGVQGTCYQATTAYLGEH
ncbi:hypothetical protein A2U01_0035517, partial [Trifolium medium]|nr:hypothetical protein [Trifolium medium]